MRVEGLVLLAGVLVHGPTRIQMQVPLHWLVVATRKDYLYEISSFHIVVKFTVVHEMGINYPYFKDCG